MRAEPGRPRCPRLLGLRGGSPLAGPGEAALRLGLLSQLKFSFQLRPALHSPAPGRALRPRRAVSPCAALSSASFWPGPTRLASYRGRPSRLSGRSPARWIPLPEPREFPLPRGGEATPASGEEMPKSGAERAAGAAPAGPPP